MDRGPAFTLDGNQVGVVSVGGTLTLMGKAAQGGVIVVMLIALVGLAAMLRNLVEIAQA